MTNKTDLIVREIKKRRGQRHVGHEKEEDDGYDEDDDDDNSNNEGDPPRLGMPPDGLVIRD